MDAQHRWIPTVACLVMATSCQGPPPAEEPIGSRPVESVAAVRLPLKEIMRGLEADLAEVAHGLWVEDHEAVGAAASRIAEHPKVTPGQMGTIQTELAAEFPVFVEQDQSVHDAAVGLAKAADAAATTAELFGIYLRIQQGCMSYHATFRARVTEVLDDEGAGR